MQNKVSDIIIIKGAPATGKSTTAKELTKYYPSGVRMEIDNLRSMVISVDWTNQKEHIDILNASSQLVANFLELKYKPIIIIDTFSGNKINDYYRQLKETGKDWKISIFGLYATEDEIRKRLDLRSDNKFKDFEICKKLNSDTIKFKHECELQIDTSNLTAIETSELIYGCIEAGIPASYKHLQKRQIRSEFNDCCPNSSAFLTLTKGSTRVGLGNIYHLDLLKKGLLEIIKNTFN